MKDHPLFNDDPNDGERRSREIDFININQWVNGKRVAIHNEWSPDALLTVTDVFNAVGEGEFELVGRENERKRVVDRVRVSIKANGAQGPINARERTPPAPQQPATPPPPAVPMMALGNMQVPPGMDPNMVMMLAMLNYQQQQSALAQTTMNAQMQAQREDSRTFMMAQQQLMTGLADSAARMVGGLLQGIGSLIPRGSGGPEGIEGAFIKGIETMAELHAGIKEGSDSNKPVDWATVSNNIVAGIRTLKDVATITNTAAPGPVIPPGTPAT